MLMNVISRVWRVSLKIGSLFWCVEMKEIDTRAKSKSSLIAIDINLRQSLATGRLIWWIRRRHTY